MLVFYKANLSFLSDHAVDPDKRRYVLNGEGPRHYINLDHYGPYPFDSLPRRWNEAVARYSEDPLQRYGIATWWLHVMQHRLVAAFKERRAAAILKLPAEIGHYMAEIHVPLHVSSNHNGQLTSQQGIHGFWESRLPELLAEAEWNFLMGRASYIAHPGPFIWQRVLESARAADTVLRGERELSATFPADQKYAFEPRGGTVVRQYSSTFATAYDRKLKGMVERHMRQSIEAVASF